MTEEHQKHLEHYQMLLEDFSPGLVLNHRVKNPLGDASAHAEDGFDDIRITFNILFKEKAYHIKFISYSETIIITEADLGFSFSLAIKQIPKYVRGLYKRNLLYAGNQFHRMHVHASQPLNIEVLKPELVKLCALSPCVQIQNIRDHANSQALAAKPKKESLVLDLKSLPKNKEEMLEILTAFDFISNHTTTLS
ncbi:hypothetical protein SAMN05216474_0565 [Lishizhenia tianjinensis]|uniref:Uncharacterized protein n=1 Tax=Lishizhenia tianjinensis TaxID=477690 RepID=A0A1I6Y062_9FLAO|nr:hypothetical protein [Lishizhenia tianjinensis]SFT43777.1 hypothetical protein SAMN05216474_0565 [Lishizhenia tianjinensis]